MILKSKVASLLVAGTLVTGGAVVGASSESFSTFLDRAAGSVIEKAAGFAGYTVYKHGEGAKADAEAHVEAEADRVAGGVLRHFNGETTRGKGEVTSHKDALKSEVTSAMGAQGAKAKAAITESVNEEVNLSNADIDQAAKDKAQSLIDQLDAFQVPADGRPSQ